MLFFADNEGPEPDCQFSIKPIGSKDGFEVYPPYVLIYLSATDKTVGTQNIFYKVNDKPEKLFKQYFGKFIKNKLNTLKIRATDKLGNQKETEIKFYIQDK